MRIAIDASPLMDRPLTGVGYRALSILEALLGRDDGFDIRFFAARARRVPKSAFPFRHGYTHRCIVPYGRRLRTALWPRIEWPPIEWFTGAVDLAHGMFHDLPAAQRAKRIATIHDLSFLFHPETHTAQTVAVQTRLVQHCVRRADALIAVSESCKNDITETYGYPEDRIHVVLGGVDLDQFAGEIDQERLEELLRKHELPASYFIHLGTVEPRKNLPRLIEAYSLLRRDRGDAPGLVLVGNAGWKSQPTLDAIWQCGVEEHVHHIGYMERADAATLLKGAVACVYPSRYEGYGLPVLEAMAARVPVITSKANALAELTAGTALHADAGRPEDLAAAMSDLLDNPEEAARRVEAAFTRAQQRTWANSAAQLAHVYRTVAVQ